MDTSQKPRRWRAKWIWAAGDGKEPNVFYYFRRELAWDGPTDSARLFIAADTRYQLFVNGQFVGRGAPQSQPYYQYYDERDLGPFLKPGANCIAVLVNYVGNQPDTRGGLLAELVDGRGQTRLITDGSWRAARAAAYAQNTFHFRMNKTAAYQEVFDSRRAPEGWNQCGFDDKGWAPATVLRGRLSDRPPAVAPWTRLLPRDIPFMAGDAKLPVAVVTVEENLDLANRLRPEDASTVLSAVGQPIRHSRAEAAESLLKGQPARFGSSTLHKDRVFDGIYDPSIVLDFGRVLPAYVRLELDGPAGSKVAIGYAERLIDGHFNNAIEGQFADTVILAGGPQTYEPFVWKSFRFLKLRFHAVNGPITVRSLRAQVSTYPYEERGLFQSSDATLNAVWDISRYTLRLCSNEFLMDTPWREQAQWLGDVAAVTVPGIYACFGDPRLPAKFLRQAAANQHSTGLIANISNAVEPAWQHDIPDYSLWWVMALWNHYLYTGEADWIHELYPVAVRIMQTHFAYVNEHGLIEDMPYWVFIDWADVDRRGECAALNAIFHGALEALEKMAAFKRDDYWREKASAARTAIAANFQKRLFDAPRGVFADARVDDRLSPKISEHANLAAIRWGLADAAAAQSILDRLYGPQPLFFTEAQPFFMVVVLQALARLGRHDLALKLVRDRWGQRMVAQGATSCHEEWGINGSWRSGEYAGFLRTLSHAWSACPAEFLIKDLMGLEILEPGCAKVCLRPVKTPFDYKAAYPTPRGAIAVECQKGEIKVSAPNGVIVMH